MTHGLDPRLDWAAGRFAEMLVAYYRLAADYHATHAESGPWRLCHDRKCRANVANVRRWRGDTPLGDLTTERPSNAPE